MPFRSGLIAQTIAAGEPMRYGFIRYELKPEDLARGKTLHNDVHWGDQTLWQHIWNFVDLHGLHAIVTFAPDPIAFSPAAVANRKVAALEAQAAMTSLAEQRLSN
jgi:hypothetical protein